MPLMASRLVSHSRPGPGVAGTRVNEPPKQLPKANNLKLSPRCNGKAGFTWSRPRCRRRRGRPGNKLVVRVALRLVNLHEAAPWNVAIPETVIVPRALPLPGRRWRRNHHQIGSDRAAAAEGLAGGQGQLEIAARAGVERRAGGKGNGAAGGDRPGAG